MISVITCTIRENMQRNLIDNYLRQVIEEKELIVILNKNNIDLKPINKNIHVYHMDEAKTLGECLNFAASLARYDIIAKFDDDDYYSPDYLSDSLRLLKEKRAGVVGKAGVFAYFKKDRLLTLYRHQSANTFLKKGGAFLTGSTLVFQKDILNKIPFKALTVGEDIQFQKDCLDHGIPLYSGGVHDYVLIRYDDEHQHTWKVPDGVFQHYCKKIAITQSFEKYVWKGEEKS